MKLISCNNCAVILDADKFYFPANIWHEHADVDETKGMYSQTQKTYVAYVKCPVCKEPIEEEG